VTALVLASSEAGVVDQPGGVFVRRAELLPADTLRMLRAAARVNVPCDGRPIARVLQRAEALAGEPEDDDLEPYETGPRPAGRITPLATRAAGGAPRPAAPPRRLPRAADGRSA